MATVNPVGTWISKGVYRTVWSGITGSDTVVNAENGARLPDKSVYVTGTFGSASIVTLKGSNLATADVTEFVDVVDPQGNPISFSAQGIEQILENPLRIRPYVSGSTGGTSITVIMLSRGDL